MVNHMGLIHRFQCDGVGGGFIGVLRCFQQGREQRLLIGEGVCSSVANVVSGVLQGSVLGPLRFLLYYCLQVIFPPGLRTFLWGMPMIPP